MNIKQFFFPEEINNYYLFSKRILGVDIGKTDIHVTQILLSGKTITIEKSFTEPIEAGAAGTNGERASVALKRIIALCDKYNEIRTSISSSQVVFKEIRLPFTSRGKIEKVVAFEVEPLLPFSIAEAAIDFIITSIDQEHQSAQVLVAAVQKQYIAQHILIFEGAGLRPDIVTVDLFAAYGTLVTAPEFETHEGIVGIVDIGFNTTRIACIYNKQLRSIRTINKGIYTLAKTVSDSMSITPAQAIENIMRFGLRENDNPTYHKAIYTSLSQLWSEVNFTFTSFAYQMKQMKGAQIVYLMGGGVHMRGLSEFVSTTMGTPCEIFDSAKLAGIANVTFKDNLSIGPDGILSLCIALPNSVTHDFNLSRELADQDRFVNIQILVTAILVFLFLGSISTYTFWQTSKASYAVQANETEAVQALHEQFPDITQKKLAPAIDEAQDEVAKEEKTWFAFSSRVRSSSLKYLLELTNRIDKQALGLDVERITIADNILTLKGRVTTFDAFRGLRKTLRESDLFGQPEAKEELDFTMTIPLMGAEEE